MTRLLCLTHVYKLVRLKRISRVSSSVCPSVWLENECAAGLWSIRCRPAQAHTHTHTQNTHMHSWSEAASVDRQLWGGKLTKQRQLHTQSAILSFLMGLHTLTTSCGADIRTATVALKAGFHVVASLQARKTRFDSLGLESKSVCGSDVRTSNQCVIRRSFCSLPLPNFVPKCSVSLFDWFPVQLRTCVTTGSPHLPTPPTACCSGGLLLTRRMAYYSLQTWG